MISEPRWKEDDGSDGAQAASGETPASEGEANPIDSLLKHVAEAREYALLYLETRKDQVRVAIRRLALVAGAGFVALAVAASALVVAVVLALSGVAHGIAALLGGRVWAGELITGGALLLGVALAGWWLLKTVNSNSARRIAKKYETRRQQLRSRFGRESAGPRDAGETHV